MREATKGFDFKRALDALQEAGAIPEPGKDGKRSRLERTKSRGTVAMRLYTVIANKLGSDYEP